jgi:hypothetical protein
VRDAAAFLAVVVLAVNLAAGALGGWRWYRVESSRAFWLLLRCGQAAILVQTLGAGALAAGGFKPADGLYFLYALLPLAVSFVAEQLRIASAETVLDARGIASARAVGDLPEAQQRSVALAIVRREIGVMTLAALVIVFLALRAIGTA